MTSPEQFTFSLAVDPWVECLDQSGQRHLVGLRELARRADQLWLAEPDPLVEAAIWRLLAAWCYASGNYPADIEDYDRQIREGWRSEAALDYLDAHRAEFDLVDTDRPWGQDAALRAAVGTPSQRPALYLDITAAVDRPLVYDRRHLNDAAPLSYRQALRVLLVTLLWGFGGRTQGSDRHLGPRATYGIASPLNGRVVMCPTGASVGRCLAWRVTPTADPGHPTWTYPGEPATQPVALAGAATGLTHLSRRVLLVPARDGQVSGVIVARGLRYQDLDPAVPAAGWADVVTTAKTALAGNAITSAEDLVPVAARIATAWPGSVLAHAAGAAARRAPHHGDTSSPTSSDAGIDWAAISLATPVRGRLSAGIAARRVHCPAAVLTVAHAADTAAALLDTRRGDSTPALGSEEYRQWLAEPTTTDHLVALTRMRAQTPARLSRAPIPLGRLLPPARTESLTRATGPSDSGKGDTMVTGNTDVPSVDATSAMSAPASSGAGEIVFDDTLFDAPSPTVRPAAAAPLADSAGAGAADIVVARLHGYLSHGHHRGTLAQLQRHRGGYDARNPALALVLRDLPADQLVAATTTAVVFADYKAQVRKIQRGQTPLPRLARSIGTGPRRGPRNEQVVAQINRILRTPSAELQPYLLRLASRLADSDRQPDWRGLYADLLRWDDPDNLARARWTLLFFDKRPAAEIAELLDTLHVKGLYR